MKQPYLIIPDIDVDSMNVAGDDVIATNEGANVVLNSEKENAWVSLPILTEWGLVRLSELQDYVLEFEADITDGSELYMSIESDEQETLKNKEHERIEIELYEDFRISLEDLGIQDYPIKKISISGDFGNGLTIKRLAIVHKDYVIPDTEKKRFHLIPKANWRGREKSLQDEIMFNPEDIQPSDIVHVRPKTEEYTEDDILELDNELKKYKEVGCKIYNTPDKIINGHFKDKALKIWEDNGVSIPNWQIVESKDDINAFMEKHSLDIALLKITDGHSGKSNRIILKGSFGFNKDETKTHIIMEIVQTDINYDLIGKAFVGNGKISNIHGYMHLRSDKENIAKKRCIEYDHFILGQKVIVRTGNNHRREILKAVGLICDTASVDFIVKGKDIFFLELNPYWGTGQQWGTTWPNNDKFAKRMLKESEIPLPLIERLDEYTMWKKYYNSL